MTFQFHRIEQKEGYAIVYVDHPPVNSLSDEVKAELLTALESIKAKNKCVILTGTGEKTFVAGADIRELANLDEESGRARVFKSKEFFSYIDNYPIPIIAAINGSALGGGFEVVMCCDISVAVKEVKIGLPEVNLGIIPGGGGTQRLTRYVSPGMAKLMIYTGKLLSADEAYQLGIVQNVVEREGLLTEAEAIARQIAKKPPLAVQSSKIAINKGLNATLEDSLNTEAELFAKLCGTKDKNEGVSAFLNKRKPVFSGE
ncbi:enoyl-CoA hydratase-related protein [Bacillus sp. B15-48]|uniref:enoyl-CoA hydratase/isomerase family protein n=1 Tax=Bacillus sp. B15-48 TaxID=1548601 RepID=UPI00193FAB37|nr:enoyl-CoA hydratase-related protein [Bacillus sp. B15-48]